MLPSSHHMWFTHVRTISAVALLRPAPTDRKTLIGQPLHMCVLTGMTKDIQIWKCWVSMDVFEASSSFGNALFFALDFVIHPYNLLTRMQV